ncbi:DUF6074 family protein [Nitratireductor sp. GISD-1A_MAKvit]|uniref:DUF6074 family protein n=1 Tax=Nitratireductor sp. GISD-1A_MAKvit TaxID=3234198 RepID=UPI003465A7B4
MSDDHNLPLFSWSPPACVVIPFPAASRIGRIRHVAQILVKKRGNDADAYWRRIIKDMDRQMARAGIEKPQREIELRSFFDGVRKELDLMAVRHGNGGTGGGAA